MQSLEKQRKSVYARELDWIKIFMEKYIKNVLNKYVFGIYGYICAVI